VWTSSQRGPLCNRTPNLKPSTEPDLQEAGLQECAQLVVATRPLHSVQYLVHLSRLQMILLPSHTLCTLVLEHGGVHRPLISFLCTSRTTPPPAGLSGITLGRRKRFPPHKVQSRILAPAIFHVWEKQEKIIFFLFFKHCFLAWILT
jgi:hypothetical protein